MTEIIPDINLGIERCINGTPARNAVFLCSEADYVMIRQTADLPYPRHLFMQMMSGNNAAIVRE